MFQWYDKIDEMSLNNWEGIIDDVVGNIHI